jgi:hypothetical protein
MLQNNHTPQRVSCAAIHANQLPLQLTAATDHHEAQLPHSFDQEDSGMRMSYLDVLDGSAISSSSSLSSSLSLHQTSGNVTWLDTTTQCAQVCFIELPPRTVTSGQVLETKPSNAFENPLN